MINEKMHALGATRSVIRELFEYGKDLKARLGEDKVFDFTLGNPSVPCPKVVNDFIAELVKSDPLGAHSYTSSQGSLGARRAVCEHVMKRHGFLLDENLTYMTCGAAASLAITLRAICSNSRDKVLTFAPFFPEYRVFAENAGATLVTAPARESDFGIDFDALPSLITEDVRAVIVNSPNNPSGAVYSEDDVIRLAKILSDKQAELNSTIYLITDEPYREILFDGTSCPFIPSYYDNTVVCYSYSKALSLPGARIGYISISPRCENSSDLYLAVLGAGRSLGYVCAPAIFQKVVEKFAGLTVDTSVYRKNRDLLVNILQGLGFECVIPQGAFYVFMKSPERDAVAFSNYAKTLGLLVVPSDSFGMSGYARLATCVPTETIERSAPAFKKLAEHYGLI